MQPSRQIASLFAFARVYEAVSQDDALDFLASPRSCGLFLGIATELFGACEAEVLTGMIHTTRQGSGTLILRTTAPSNHP
jgi:hypothetical protein